MLSTSSRATVRALKWPLFIYLVTRALNAVFLSLGAAEQAGLTDSAAMRVISPVPASPGYWAVLANWDGQWYKSIALYGYPNELPTSDGEVIQNEWAFFPLFPACARLVMNLTGTSFEVSSGSINLLFGAAAICVLYCMLSARVGNASACATIAVLCAFPTAPVLQVAYTESLALLLLALAFASLQARRYELYLLLAILLGLTRPVAIPMIMVVTMHWLVRLKDSPRHEVSLGPCRWIIASFAATAFAAGLWPLIVWVKTGNSDGFLLTQAAWRLVDSSSFLASGTLGQVLAGGISGALLVVVFFASLGISVFSPAGRRWGIELRTWVLAYPTFIMVMTQPTMSIARFMLLAAVPWWPLTDPPVEAAPVRDRIVRWTALSIVISCGLLSQYFWVTRVFTVDVSPWQQAFP